MEAIARARRPTERRRSRVRGFDPRHGARHRADRLGEQSSVGGIAHIALHHGGVGTDLVGAQQLFAGRLGRASELLRRVEAGETIEITDRGRPVALLSPLPQGGPYEQLLASGEIERATLDVVDLPEPLDLDAGVELPSVTLARLREHER